MLDSPKFTLTDQLPLCGQDSKQSPRTVERETIISDLLDAGVRCKRDPDNQLFAVVPFENRKLWCPVSSERFYDIVQRIYGEAHPENGKVRPAQAAFPRTRSRMPLGHSVR